MTSLQITELIEGEIGTDWSRSNAHGVNLKVCLVPPLLQEYQDGFEPEKQVSLWLVLEEDPVSQSGYKIVYSDLENMFGLAVCGHDYAIFIGYYGTFLETLEAM